VVYEINEPERQPLESLLAALCDWGLYWCDKTDARVLALDRLASAAESTHNMVY
jgi:hypothetical protein